MRHIRQLLPFAAMLLAGCASTPPDRLRADYPKEEAQIRYRLNEIIDAAEKKDFNRLDSYHFYGAKFTKFAPEAPGRQDAEVARKAEHDGIGAATDLQMQVDLLKIDVFGNVGIATFDLKYGFKAASGRIEKSAHATMVFVKETGAWKIAHEHLSALKANP